MDKVKIREALENLPEDCGEPGDATEPMTPFEQLQDLEARVAALEAVGDPSPPPKLAEMTACEELSAWVNAQLTAMERRLAALETAEQVPIQDLIALRVRTVEAAEESTAHAKRGAHMMERVAQALEKMLEPFEIVPKATNELNADERTVVEAMRSPMIPTTVSCASGLHVRIGWGIGWER